MEKQNVARMDLDAASHPQRRANEGMQHLFLRELDPADVFDRPQALSLPLLSFGTVRETCPHCAGQHLKLILRQETVRLAHLFCEHCHACFDARYANGRCALTI
ncbi:hypothetical protein [Pseudoduganella sp. GCM10020061]|uniref:hypothetical protein n=1 Tax=Pseudoduganella sp. GCM10020061 TaxID=3317345 RepID=UPI0036407D98